MGTATELIEAVTTKRVTEVIQVREYISALPNIDPGDVTTQPAAKAPPVLDGILTGLCGTQDKRKVAVENLAALHEQVWSTDLPGYPGACVQFREQVTEAEPSAWARLVTPKYEADVGRLTPETLATMLLAPRAIVTELGRSIAATRRKKAGLADAKASVYHTRVGSEIKIDGYTLSVYCWTDVCCWLGEKPTV